MDLSQTFTRPERGFCHPERSEGDPSGRTPRRLPERELTGDRGISRELAAKAAARHTSAEALLPVILGAARLDWGPELYCAPSGRPISPSARDDSTSCSGPHTPHSVAQEVVLQHLCAEPRLQPRAHWICADSARQPRSHRAHETPRDSRELIGSAPIPRDSRELIELIELTRLRQLTLLWASAFRTPMHRPALLQSVHDIERDDPPAHPARSRRCSPASVPPPSSALKHSPSTSKSISPTACRPLPLSVSRSAQ
jgi:hypothetical protein